MTWIINRGCKTKERIKMNLQQKLVFTNITIIFFNIALLLYGYFFKSEWLIGIAIINGWFLVLILIFLLVIFRQSKKEIEDAFKNK